MAVGKQELSYLFIEACNECHCLFEPTVATSRAATGMLITRQHRAGASDNGVPGACAEPPANITSLLPRATPLTSQLTS